MYFLVIVGLSYILYIEGLRLLIRSKLLENKNASLYAYILLMLSGITVGEYLSIKYLPYFFDLSKVELIILTAIISIIAGELIYYRNYKLVKKIVAREKKDTKL